MSASGASLGPHSSRWGALPAGVLAFLLIAALGLNGAGYFPPAWGWSALALLWITMLVLVFGKETRIAILPLAWFGALLALLLWIFASLFWTDSVTRTVLEGERMIVYVGAAAAVLLLARAGAHRALIVGTWAAITLVSGYALLSRLFPGRIGSEDTNAAYRLSQPIGYWNALGLFAAVGALLALGLAARAERRIIRVLCSASLPPLALTVYFTFSRGAWIALGIGLAAAILLDPRRLQLVTATAVSAPAAAIAVSIAYQSSALTHIEASPADATAQGHRLGIILMGLVAANALLAIAFSLAERRIAVPAALRIAYGAALALVVVLGIVSTFVRYGDPVTLARRGYDAFAAPPAATTNDLNEHLFSFSGTHRIPQWRVAWKEYEAHRLVGSGSGTYELYWNQHRPTSAQVRDAHSLYVETLAELGPVGLGFLGLALGLPLAAAVRARRDPYVPATLGAYTAYLAHAAVDWDWELPAVTLAALFCGAALLLAGLRNGKGLEHRRGARLARLARLACIAATLALVGFSFVGLVANNALRASKAAADQRQIGRAVAKAHTAVRWAPWSADAWKQLAQAQLYRDPRAARESLRRAIDKDSRDWELWYLLAVRSDGRERSHALAVASRLSPRSSDIAQFRRAFARPPG